MAEPYRPPQTPEEWSVSITQSIAGEPLRSLGFARPYDFGIRFNTVMLHFDTSPDEARRPIQIAIVEAGQDPDAPPCSGAHAMAILAGRKAIKVLVVQLNDVRIHFEDAHLYIRTEAPEIDFSAVGLEWTENDIREFESVPALKAAISSWEESTSEYEVSHYDDIVYRLVHKTCLDLKDFFESQLSSPNTDKVRVSVEGLSLLPQIRSIVIPTLVKLLEHKNDIVVSDAIYALDTLNYWFSKNDIERFWRSSNDYVRRAALKAARKVDHSQHVHMIQEAFHDDNPRIREAACDGVEDCDLDDLRPLVEAATKDPDPEVREVAADCIERMNCGSE
ncbi:MAG: HEAT repeat domain-containing protein [Acidobacteria bacterium]|nr:HEAT repeat domain-containing protein [Acidobacteriota bacterium]MDA1235430.1 HEAT repeat domain-containing protein [Acidobacteriota bacterium]